MPATPAAQDQDGLPIPRRIVAAASVIAALVLVVLDGAIANIALPTIARSLGVAPAGSVWVVTGYQMALVMALLPAGALGEAMGYRRVFMGGVVVFATASAACAFAPGLPWLVAARFAQGLGGAAMMALTIALLRFIYPQRLMGAALGWNALTVALSSAAGPTIGAAILSVASWPWLFAINIPLGAIVLLTARALPRPRGSARRIDLGSVALNALAFAALVVGAEALPSNAAEAVGLLAVGALALTVLIRRESRKDAPLIPLDLLRAHSFRVSVASSVCCFAAQMAGAVALPFYLQHGLGRDAFTAGLFMTPWPLAVAVAAPLSGRLSDRMSTAWLCAAGGICLSVGLSFAARPLQHGLTPLIGFMVISGLGFGFFQTPNNRNMLLSAPKARSGAAGGMQGTARLTGQTVGAVAMALLFKLTTDGAAPRLGLALAAGLALAGGLVSLLRVPARRVPAASTP